MSRPLPPARGISEAWVEVLEAMNAEPDGTATNVMVTIPAPSSADQVAVRRVLDEELRKRGNHEVSTVANTLFPSAFYMPPDFAWSPELPQAQVDELDAAASSLYAEYLEILPLLTRVQANKGGTYFSRMIAWPGKVGPGTNQLHERVTYLRSELTHGRRTSNASDLVIAGDGEGVGIQEYAATDRRTRGFPCLVHIDLSVHKGTLALTAIYRHWHLITRAYGNMLGLARLQEFMCQQTGLAVGELVVIAGYANAEHSEYGGRSGVTALLERARALPDTPEDETAAA
ncbi:hypothetical protein [Agromyces bauzanensis]|uniref:Thymidylate synthase n=1 Tax=Agromyces bauzanensis TaxID=1308924 RepID=A0A917PQ13_9MICO|nr:hypothetical protein [Agromyces bauzanensis]GGJ87449.1 hypothetical protein GCM10011372_27440 [Agromyces bauzanensis]